jgi:hypothetical protein
MQAPTHPSRTQPCFLRLYVSVLCPCSCIHAVCRHMWLLAQLLTQHCCHLAAPTYPPPPTPTNAPPCVLLLSRPLTVSSCPQVVRALKRRGIEALFPIQGMVLRPAMEGIDLTARAKTGSGKTLAFALPVVESLLAEDTDRKTRKTPGRAPRCVVEVVHHPAALLWCLLCCGAAGLHFFSLCLSTSVAWQAKPSTPRQGVHILQ